MERKLCLEVWIHSRCGLNSKLAVIFCGLVTVLLLGMSEVEASSQVIKPLEAQIVVLLLCHAVYFPQLNQLLG